MKQRLFKIILSLFLMPFSLLAQETLPEAGKTYVFFHTQTGKVLSNLRNLDNNAPIFVENYKLGDFGQVWKLNIVPGRENTYTIENQVIGKSLDLVLQNMNKRPLQWTTDINNPNQWVEVISRKVNGKAGFVFASASNRYPQRYIAIDDYKGQIKLTDDESKAAHWTLTPAKQPKLETVDWQDETVFAENIEEGHAYRIPYASTQEMRRDKAHYDRPWETPNSSRIQTLNGIWKLKWTKDIANLDSSFVADGYDTSSMDTITVPSCLEMKGYGLPHYINVDYAFADTPPFIKMKPGLFNSVANYRREFTLSGAWLKDRILLHFEGLSAGAYVWVNGKRVGYTQPGNNDVEFDITPYVREGKNNVSVQLIRWTDASYIEGQDMWHFSGIHRDAYLVSVPRTFVRDHYITAQMTASSQYKSGVCNVMLDLDNRDGKAHTATYGVKLLDVVGKVVHETEKTHSFAQNETSHKLNFEFGVLNVEPWTAETPNLYTVEVYQKENGKETLAFSTKYGFRMIELRNNVYHINGQRIFFRGVNTQDIHPIHGRSLDVRTMLHDIVMMKQGNVNTVRTSHYPRQAKMNAMFDYYGLYVMDEADVECHKNWEDNKNGSGITSKASWRDQIVYRNRTMVLRDRNYPSVIFWSLGNESHSGSNFIAAYDEIHKLDTRPIHYEGASRLADSQYRKVAASDMASDMYPSLEETRKKCTNNFYGPYFICEYAHAMGNAVGNLQEYWDIIEGKPNLNGIWVEESPRGIGGCIWDWVDQGIYASEDIRNGKLVQPETGFHFFKSGYDYPGPHQGNFMSNGIIAADRKWSAKLTEVKQVYQSVKFTKYDAATRQLKLMNRYNFTDLANFDLQWRVLVDGDVKEKGTLAIPSTKTRNYANITIPFTTSLQGDKEITLQVDVVLKAATSWAQAGHSVAAFETILLERQNLPKVEVAEGQVQLTKGVEGYVIKTAKQEITFSPTFGMSQWLYDGKVFCHGMGTPAFDSFRWIENDRNVKNAQHTVSQEVTATRAADGKSVTVVCQLFVAACPTTLTYTFYANEVVDLHAEFNPNSKDLQRIGLKMYVKQPLNNVRYYARGPWENYVDRKTGSRLGCYTTTVADMFTPYAHPQTCGGREDLRELMLFDEDGNGWKVETEGQVSFSALHYADAQFRPKELHPYDLTPATGVFLHFDQYHRGIGNGSCGPGTLNKYYCPAEGVYDYKLRFTPVDNSVTGLSVPAAIRRPQTMTYDLLGRAVEQPQNEGIYIVDGQKKWIK